MRQPVEVLKRKIALPERILLLDRAFREHNEKLYLVGGAVRDEKPKDYDLVTGALPDRVSEIVRSTGKVRVREVGKAFGVVLATFDGDNEFEIATFRKDAKTGDGRRPDFVTFSSLEEDADRRDLTINALYYDIQAEEVLDFHGGLEDLRQGRVRFVGDPAERLEEDRLRALRFVRFHCRCNGNGAASLDKDARQAIRKLELRPKISGERIRDEFLKGLDQAQNVKLFLDCLNDLGLLQQVFPHLQVRKDIWFAAPHAAVIAQVLRDNDPAKVKTFLDRYTAQEVEDIVFLVGLKRWGMDDIVDYRKMANRISMTRTWVWLYARCLGLPNETAIARLGDAPYPTVKSEEVMADGFEGKALGLEIKKREVANFHAWVRRVDV